MDLISEIPSFCPPVLEAVGPSYSTPSQKHQSLHPPSFPSSSLFPSLNQVEKLTCQACIWIYSVSHSGQRLLKIFASILEWAREAVRDGCVCMKFTGNTQERSKVSPSTCAVLAQTCLIPHQSLQAGQKPSGEFVLAWSWYPAFITVLSVSYQRGKGHGLCGYVRRYEPASQQLPVAQSI